MTHIFCNFFIIHSFRILRFAFWQWHLCQKGLSGIVYRKKEGLAYLEIISWIKRACRTSKAGTFNDSSDSDSDEIKDGTHTVVIWASHRNTSRIGVMGAPFHRVFQGENSLDASYGTCACVIFRVLLISLCRRLLLSLRSERYRDAY